ncbi:MAG: hypothetical protein K2N67_07525 [Mucispirillum sp.]|nr:hypothetical protein [Mucispirillum sp.]
MDEAKVKSHIEPMPDGSYEIYKNDTKAFRYVLAAFVCAVISVYFLKYSSRIVYYIFLAGFIGASAMALKTVLFKKVVLTVTDKFIIFYTPLGSPEKILWDDIMSFKEMRVKRERFIGIVVKDPETILETQTNKIAYKIMRLNLKAYETPFIFATNTLSAHHKEILNLLNDQLELYNSGGML